MFDNPLLGLVMRVTVAVMVLIIAKTLHLIHVLSLDLTKNHLNREIG